MKYSKPLIIMEECDTDEEIDDSELASVITPEELKRRKEFCEFSRLFSETNWAIQCLKIIEEVEQTCRELREGFLIFAYRSLWDAALTCLMRVLDEHRDAFSFWKISELEIRCAQANVDLKALREFSARLRKARNKSHFHIDKDYAADPDELWRELNIKRTEMFEAANQIAEILSQLLVEEYNFPANLSRYDAKDVRPILQFLHQHALGNLRIR